MSSSDQTTAGLTAAEQKESDLHSKPIEGPRFMTAMVAAIMHLAEGSPEDIVYGIKALAMVDAFLYGQEDAIRFTKEVSAYLQTVVPKDKEKAILALIPKANADLDRQRVARNNTDRLEYLPNTADGAN